MRTIAILMTVFNRKDTTIRCLTDLNNQQYDRDTFHIDVYLTDDGCTDGTPEAISKLFPDVKIISGDGSLFWNRGMYVAWCEAVKNDYDYYLWLNDDTFIKQDAISRLLVDSSIYHDRAIIVGSTCEVGNPSKITYGGWSNYRLNVDLSTHQVCDAINGNIVLVPRSVYKVLGTNDPYYRHAAGDTDYGFRAKEHGIPVYTGIGIFGECNLHEKSVVWMDPTHSFVKRWNNFLSPVGNNPFEMFYFKRKHYGLFLACITFITNWTHFFFPWFWPSCYKKYK